MLAAIDTLLIPSMACHFLLMASFCSVVRGMSKAGSARVAAGVCVPATSSVALTTVILWKKMNLPLQNV